MTGGLPSIDEALRLVLERVVPLESEEVACDESVGRVLAVDALAAVDLPPFPSSAMDGFAVRSSDLPGTLALVGAIAAGRPAAAELAAGQAMAIATGGAVPVGADTVVPIEDATVEAGSVVVKGNASRGSFVRDRGGDVSAGALVVSAGTRLGAAQVGALAAAGITTVRCTRAPRVAVLVTGTELRSPGDALGPGEIYDANGPMLAAQLRTAGAMVERLPAVSDDADALRAALERGLEADVLITTGGVSVGVHDLVRGTSAELGVDEVFWGVAVRPGKPIAFGARGRTLVFGLPGNPVSTLVGFELFVRPALLALQGASEPGPVFRPGRLGPSVRRTAARDSLLRARTTVAGEFVVLEPVSGQESHMIARAATADALVFVPRGDGELEAGSAVSYLSL
jgi:molybdopterin molybdotransferase